MTPQNGMKTARGYKYTMRRQKSVYGQNNATGRGDNGRRAPAAGGGCRREDNRPERIRRAGTWEIRTAGSSGGTRGDRGTGAGGRAGDIRRP